MAQCAEVSHAWFRALARVARRLLLPTYMMRMTLGMMGILALGCSGGSDLGSESQPLDQCTMGTTTVCDSSDAYGVKAAGEKSCKPGDRGYVWGDCQAIACTGSTVACTTKSGA